MDIRIGISHTSKELEIEMPDDADPKKVRAEVEKAIKEEGVVWLTDRRGRVVGVPSAKLGFIEFGGPDDGRRIGFGG